MPLPSCEGFVSDSTGSARAAEAGHREPFHNPAPPAPVTGITNPCRDAEGRGFCCAPSGAAHPCPRHPRLPPARTQPRRGSPGAPRPLSNLCPPAAEERKDAGAAAVSPCAWKRSPAASLHPPGRGPPPPRPSRAQPASPSDAAGGLTDGQAAGRADRRTGGRPCSRAAVGRVPGLGAEGRRGGDKGEGGGGCEAPQPARSLTWNGAEARRCWRCRRLPEEPGGPRGRAARRRGWGDGGATAAPGPASAPWRAARSLWRLRGRDGAGPPARPRGGPRARRRGGGAQGAAERPAAPPRVNPLAAAIPAAPPLAARPLRRLRRPSSAAAPPSPLPAGARPLPASRGADWAAAEIPAGGLAGGGVNHGEGGGRA